MYTCGYLFSIYSFFTGLSTSPVEITAFKYLLPQQAIDAKTIKDVCTKYIFNKAPAIAAVGMFEIQIGIGALDTVQEKCTWILSNAHENT